MEDNIKLIARYGLTHQLKHINDKLYQLELDKNSAGTYRIIGFEGQSPITGYVYAIDPEGGPFISVGSKINNLVVKSITSNGIIEFE